MSSSFSKDLSHEAKTKDLTLKAKLRPRTSKLSSKILEDEDLSSRTRTLIIIILAGAQVLAEKVTQIGDMSPTLATVRLSGQRLWIIRRAVCQVTAAGKRL